MVPRAFAVNNSGKPPNEVDLHGLYAEEAKEYANKALSQALGRQEPRLLFIVGKVGS